MENKIKNDGYSTTSLVLIAGISLFMIMGFIFSGCSDSVTSPTTNAENLSISVKTSDVAMNNPLASIQITEAKALISEFEIESTDSTSNEVKLTPFVVNFDLSSTLKEVLSVYIPTKTYRKVKFQIHKPEDTETPPDPEFKDASGRYSFIVKGTYNGNAFVFKSKKSVNLLINMNNTVNINSNKVNISMLINKLMWFKDGGGNEIDPRESGNENTIDDNLRNSFKSVFKDDDRNGVEDN
ncbi:MAG: hypothetical protein WCK13_02500 [Ignavibacteriota bacterium]|nr:hypothetical protein [Ignavibacteriota bacterium]